MRVDIRLAHFATKPRFKNANCKFYPVQIPKAANMKIPTQIQHEGARGLRKFHTNEAWWWILSM